VTLRCIYLVQSWTRLSNLLYMYGCITIHAQIYCYCCFKTSEVNVSWDSFLRACFKRNECTDITRMMYLNQIEDVAFLR